MAQRVARDGGPRPVGSVARALTLLEELRDSEQSLGVNGPVFLFVHHDHIRLKIGDGCHVGILRSSDRLHARGFTEARHRHRGDTPRQQGFSDRRNQAYDAAGHLTAGRGARSRGR